MRESLFSSECHAPTLQLTEVVHRDIVVCWPNKDGSWTLSHRSAPSTVMPTLIGTANKDHTADSSGSLKIVRKFSSSSQTDSPAVVVFERPLKLRSSYKGKGDAYQLQRAINQVRPDSSAFVR